MSQKTKRRRLQATIDQLRKELASSLQIRNWERNNARMEIASLERRLAHWMATHTCTLPLYFKYNTKCPRLDLFPDGPQVVVDDVRVAAVLVQGDRLHWLRRHPDDVRHEIADDLARLIIRDGLMVRIDDPARQASCFAVAVGTWKHPDSTPVKPV